MPDGLLRPDDGDLGRVKGSRWKKDEERSALRLRPHMTNMTAITMTAATEPTTGAAIHALLPSSGLVRALRADGDVVAAGIISLAWEAGTVKVWVVCTTEFPGAVTYDTTVMVVTCCSAGDVTGVGVGVGVKNVPPDVVSAPSTELAVAGTTTADEELAGTVTGSAVDTTAVVWDSTEAAAAVVVCGIAEDELLATTGADDEAGVLAVEAGIVGVVSLIDEEAGAAALLLDADTGAAAALLTTSAESVPAKATGLESAAGPFM